MEIQSRNAILAHKPHMMEYEKITNLVFHQRVIKIYIQKLSSNLRWYLHVLGLNNMSLNQVVVDQQLSLEEEITLLVQVSNRLFSSVKLYKSISFDQSKQLYALGSLENMVSRIFYGYSHTGRINRVIKAWITLGYKNTYV